MEQRQHSSTDDGRRELEDAFAAFSDTSLRLESAYVALETRVGRLTEELAAARDERHRQAEDRLRLARRLKGLLEALPGGVVVLDGSDRVVEANPAAAELLGEPLLGRAWQEITSRAFRALDAGGEIVLHSGRRLALSRRELVCETGQIILLTDTTERHALEELLQRHDRLSSMGEMAASLAHQIRTPLASALLYATNAAGPGLDDGVRHGLLDKLVDRLHDLEHLIEDMLLFARGGGQTARGVSVAGMLRHVQTCVAPQLGPCQRVQVAATDETLTLDGNEQALSGAILNLVTNALTAAGADARVRLAARPAGLEALEIAVTDNGPGVDPEQVEQIFAPFFSTRPGGTGLGLAVVRAVAQAHGGGVRADGGTGGGARFVLRLPLARTAHPGVAA